jgi:hypothetical protein
MKKGYIIFNGIRFPYYLVDRAIAWAEKNKTALYAVFLKGKEHEERYPFPSDLDASEKMTNKKDAEKDDEALIQDDMKLLGDMAKAKGVEIQAEVLYDPTKEEVLKKIKDAALVFVDSNADSDDIAAPTKFTLKELLEELKTPVEQVDEED